MSIFKRRKKRKKEVEFTELGKGEVRWLRIGRTDIVAMRLTEMKHIKAKGEVGALPLKAKGEYGKGESGDWIVFVKAEDAPLMSLEEWKKKSAETISTSTSTTVTSGDVRITTVTPPPPTWTTARDCPNCGEVVLGDHKYCPSCARALKAKH